MYADITVWCVRDNGLGSYELSAYSLHASWVQNIGTLNDISRAAYGKEFS